MSKNEEIDNNKAETPFSSNGVRLSGREWIIVAAVVLAAVFVIPSAWERFEKFSPGPDYRIDYKLGNDYWLYNRYCKTACAQNDVLVVGDSVIWGHYVRREQTLPHYLNETNVGEQPLGSELIAEGFANLGLDGIHPAAMEGLLRYYGKHITNKKVILHFNPLWMSSPKEDLQTEKEFVFNHPKLVAQFTPKIPCYKAALSTKISNVVRRYFSFPSWLSHLNITYYSGTSMPEWTLENPCQNPFAPTAFNRSDMDNRNRNRDSNSIPNPITIDQWVMPADSLQWSCFRRTIQLLKKRQNQVFVLVGPFNENMLEGINLESYRNLKKDAESRLGSENIPYYSPPKLPVEFYFDASHPTAEGYELLAKQLRQNEAFNAFISDSGRD